METVTEVSKDKSMSGTKNDCSSAKTSKKDAAVELVNGFGGGAIDGEEDDDSEATEIESLPDDDAKTAGTTPAATSKVEVLRKEPRAKMSMSPNKGPMGSSSPNPHGSTSLSSSLISSRANNARKCTNSTSGGNANRNSGKSSRLKAASTVKEQESSDNLDEEEALSDESDFNTARDLNGKIKNGKENEIPSMEEEESLDNVTDAEIEDMIKSEERALEEVRKILSAERRSSVSPCRSDASGASLPRRVGPRARKSCPSSNRSSPVPESGVSKKNAAKPKTAKNDVKSNPTGSLSKYSLPLKEFEKSLGIKGQSLAKMDAKTLDKLILEKSSNKSKSKELPSKCEYSDDSVKSVVPLSEVGVVSVVTNDEISDAGDSVTTECTDETSETVSVVTVRKKPKSRRKKLAGTYRLPGQKSYKGKQVKRLRRNFSTKAVKGEGLPLDSHLGSDDASVSMESQNEDSADLPPLSVPQDEIVASKENESTLDESSMSWTDEIVNKVGEDVPETKGVVDAVPLEVSAPASLPNAHVGMQQKKKAQRKKKGTARRIPWNKKKMSKKARWLLKAEEKANQLATSAVSIIAPEGSINEESAKTTLIETASVAEPTPSDAIPHPEKTNEVPEKVEPLELTENSGEALQKVIVKKTNAKFKKGKVRKAAKKKVTTPKVPTAGPSTKSDSSDLPPRSESAAQSETVTQTEGPSKNEEVPNSTLPSKPKPLPKDKRKQGQKPKEKSPQNGPVLPKAKAGKAPPAAKGEKPKSILEGPLPNLLRKKFAQLAKARESGSDSLNEPMEAGDKVTGSTEQAVTKEFELVSEGSTLVARVRDAEKLRDQSKSGIVPQHSSLTKCSNDSTYLTPSSSSSSSSSSSKSSASPSPVESLLSSKSLPLSSSSSSSSSKLTAAASSSKASSSSSSSASKATSSKTTPSSSSSSSQAPSITSEPPKADSVANNCDVTNSSDVLTAALDNEAVRGGGRRSLRKRKATAHPCGCDCQHHDHLSRLQQRSKKKKVEKKSPPEASPVSVSGDTPILTPIKNELPDMTNKCPSPTPPTISPMHPLAIAQAANDAVIVSDCKRKLHLASPVSHHSSDKKQSLSIMDDEEEEEEDDDVVKNEIKKQMLNLEQGTDGRSTPTRFVSTPNGILYPVTPPKTPDNGGQGDQSSQLRRLSEERDFIPLCCCKISGTNFMNGTQVMYCQALDSIDGKVIGCCTKVTNHQLVRPAVKIPFMAICELHRARLMGHQCCPGCGHFCSQGKFLQCKKDGGAALHLFHKQCQVFKDNKYYCPHCGEESDQYEVLLQLNEPRGSSFFVGAEPKPQLKPRAKMSWGTTARRKSIEEKESTTAAEEEKTEEEEGVTVKLNKDITLTSGGLPPGPSKTQLEAAFAVLNGDKPKKARTGPKSLHHAARTNDLDKLLGLLGDGIDPDTKYDDHDGETALHAAASTGRAGIVHLLLQAGASPHVPDVALRTPLMEAAEHGNLDCVKLLVKAGAVVNAKGEDGMSSLHLAAKAGNLDVFKFLLHTSRIEINIKDDGGWTPIIWAAEYDHLEIVKFILSNGGDPNIRDNEENTGLHWAAYAGSVDVAEYFLNAGCELESANERGDRPLHIASRQDHYECVVLFLARGADSEARNNENDVPIACCADQSSQTWMALRVNRQLKGFAAKRLKRPERLLHRDITMGREMNPITVVNDTDEENYPTDFQYVKENVETSPMNVNRVITSLQQCLCKDDCSSMFCVCSRNSVRCWYDKEGHLVKEFNQTEPPLIFECNRACRCWATCQNRVVQLGITCRLQVFRTNGRGWGVRTLLDIPAGTFVCEYVGEHISDAEADSREDDSYLFDLDNKDSDTFCVDARKYANVARFINHLCEPNLIPVKVFVEHQDLRFPHICFFSSRDIKAYEELGFDYGEKFWIIKWKQFTCECGSAKCKYSKTTIHQTIEDYNKRQMEEEAMEME